MEHTTLILGIGNILLGDEGFGVHVAQRLKRRTLPENVRVEEGHTGGFKLLGLLEGVERLIVVDAMITDLPPGQVRLLGTDAGLSEPGKKVVSFHQFGILELLNIWTLIGREPEVFFLVASPVDMSMGMNLSPQTDAAADSAAELIMELSVNNFAGLERSKSVCS